MTEQLSEWVHMIDALETEGSVPGVILESWQRSESAGIGREVPQFHQVSQPELRQRLADNEAWLEIARGHVEWLSKAFKHLEHVVYVTDRHGIVLHSTGHKPIVDTFALYPGSDWSEARMGTNGAGTALVANRPVAVVGRQHYVDAFGDCTCTGAPIRASDDSVIGAIDISTPVADAAPERLFVVAHAAYAIGRTMALRETRARYSEAEARLHAALSASDAGTFRWDPRTGRFLEFDASLKRLLGLDSAHALEVTEDFIRCVHPEDRSRVAAAVDACRRGDDFEMEYRVVLPDGSVRWLFDRARMVPDEDGVPGHLVGACIDITQRKIAEQSLIDTNHRLSESESRLSAAVEIAALGIWELDHATGAIQGDRRWAEIMGIEDGRSLGIAELREMVHLEDRLHIDTLAGTTAHGPFDVEYRVGQPDGSLKWVAVRGRAIVPSGEGGAVRLLGTLMDVTDRRRSQEELQASLEREREVSALMDAIFSAAPIGLGFWDRDLRFRRVNPLLAQMNGFPPEAHIGRRPDEFLEGIEDLPDILVQWQRILDHGEPLYNVEVRGATGPAAGGERVWVEDFFPVRVDDRIIGLGAVIEDVTERRRVEDALRESEKRYRALFDAMDEGFCVMEPIRNSGGGIVDFRYAEANRAFYRHAGTADAAGRGLLEVMGEEADVWIDMLSAVLTTGETVRSEASFRMLGRTLEVSAYRVDHSLIGVIFTDVTQRRRTEAALREADRAKDEFLAVLGHELRNPLAPLRTGLDLLEHSGDSLKIVSSVRPMMDRQLSHLVRLVDDLLDLSRITRGTIELQRAPLDLNACMEAAVEQLVSVMQERQHQFLVELTYEELPIHGDLERLTQVVANLLSNAGKYTGPGGTIRLSSVRERDQAVIRVADNGYGIPSDRFEKLFKLFSQVPEHQARTGGGGLGIGLALCRQLVELHGGSIDAQSEGLGRGSTFTVRLPLTSSAHHRDDDAMPGMHAGKGCRVLVVDDNADAAEALRTLIELNGHVVEAVHDGPAALAAVEDRKPDVVLLDVGMPGMDGLEVARRLRSRYSSDQLVLVAVTGWGQSDDHSNSGEAGFDHHLTKPVQWRQLELILAERR